MRKRNPISHHETQKENTQRVLSRNQSVKYPSISGLCSPYHCGSFPPCASCNYLLYTFLALKYLKIRFKEKSVALFN